MERRTCGRGPILSLATALTLVGQGVLEALIVGRPLGKRVAKTVGVRSHDARPLEDSVHGPPCPFTRLRRSSAITFAIVGG